MKNKIGNLFIIFGAVLIISALSLFAYNKWEANRADEYVVEVLPELMEEVPKEPTTTPAVIPEPETSKIMPEVSIKGNDYIGYLDIPSLGLKLPVISAWSYPKLKIAPCRYSGSVNEENLVILAHNYNAHFGRLKKLPEGENVFFTDMDGVTYEYIVKVRDISEPTAVEEVTSGEFDLTLFTCTPGGAQRVVVYCDFIEE